MSSIESTQLDLPKGNITTQECSEIRHLWYSGKPIDEIGAVVDRHRETVRRHLKGECDCGAWIDPINYSQFKADRFGCPLCNERFERRQILRSHLVKVHNGD